MKNNYYKKRKIFAIFLLWASLFSLFGYFAFQMNDKTKIKAHPTKEIKLNEGEDKEFIVPKDAEKMFEPTLMEQTKFNQYLQSPDHLEYIAQKNLNSHAVKKASNQVMASTKLPNGNYLMAQEAYWLANFTSGVIILEVNQEGAIERSYPMVSNVSGPEYLGASQSFVSNDDINYGYGFAKVGEGAGNLTINTTSTGTSSFNSVSTTAVGSTGNYFYGTLLTPKPNTSISFVSGQIVFLDGSDTSAYGIDHGVILPLFTHDNVSKQTSWAYPMGLRYKPIRAVVPKQTYDFVWPLKIKELKNDKLLVQLNYHSSRGGANTQKVSTIQIFDRAKNATYGSLNQIVQSETQSPPGIGIGENSLLQIQEEISDEDNIYFTMNAGVADTEIYHYDVVKNIFKKVKVFPKGANLRIFPSNKDGTYRYMGYVEDMALGEWASYGHKGKKVVTGLMDKRFNLLSVQTLDVNNSVTFTYMDAIGEGKYFVNGQTLATDFSKKPSPWTYNENGEFETTGQTVFMGSLEASQDYSPAIKAGASVEINLDDPTLKNKSENQMEWTNLDNWLITGEKNGTLASSKAIKVYDQVDLKDSADKKTEEWLGKRINRNPHDVSLPIDWLSLGFDRTKAGPQRVTYFVTDSQKQATTTSRWVDKLTDQTVKKDSLALDAQNFAIPLEELQKKEIISTNEKFKTLSKTVAWNTESHEIAEESSTGQFSEKVTLNQSQLKSLQEATKIGTYPVDITYKEGTISVTNRVWVFVTGPTTSVDTNYVMYLENYRLPLHEVATEDTEKTYTHSNVKVYKYNDAESEIDDEPALQADKTTSELLQVKQEEVQALQQATPENADKEDVFPLTITFKDKEGKQVQGISHATVYHGKANLEIRFVE